MLSIYQRAKNLRKNMTEAEKILWQGLRNSKLGIKFKRQKPFIIGSYNFVADFYCPVKKLIIEIDGDIHSGQEVKEYDVLREDIFKEVGYKILRFKNTEIFTNFNFVLDKIKSY